MSIDFKVTANDIIIRQANNGWIVFEVSPEGDEIETNVFEDNDYTAVGEVIQHVFEDYTQTKRKGGFVLDWYPAGWEHPDGRREAITSEDFTESLDANLEPNKKVEV